MADTQRDNSFFRRLLGAVAIVSLALGLLYALSQVLHILLLLFAAILTALFLDGLAYPAQRFLRFPRLLAIIATTTLAVLAIVGFGIALGPQLMEQSQQLGDLLPRSLERLRGWAQQQAWLNLLTEMTPRQLSATPTALLGQLSGIFSTTIGFFASIAIVLVMAFYLAIQPAPYVGGLVRMFPQSRRARAREILRLIGRALRWWLVGRAISMTAVGLLTLFGLWFIDLPAALALAVIAGLMSFVPYFGPIAAAIPALLISLSGLPWEPLWVLAVYSAVQFLEGNFVTPIVQERAVALPPVVLLTSQVAAGVLFGLLGVLLATPLAVAVIVIVQTVYIQDILRESVHVLGEHPAER